MTTLRTGDVELYYEVHGDDSREKVLCMGGWGSFCHGRFADTPRALRDNYQILIWDYPGIGQSLDDQTRAYRMGWLAESAAAIVDHLGWPRVHVVGMVGMGACVGQELAVARPDLTRSLLMTGCWASVDPTLRDMLEVFRDVHHSMGFDAFQRFVASFSFDPVFYNQHRSRILGPQGAWGDLQGRAAAHARLVDACLAHDALDRLDRITCPSFVLHAALDSVTPPRTTMPLERGIPNCVSETWDDLYHVIAGKDMKVRFDRTITSFLATVP